MSELEALAARAAISDVLATYARGVDCLDMELVRRCYFADAEEDRGRFRGPLEEFLSWLEATLRSLESTWHLLGMPLIALDGDVLRRTAWATTARARRRVPPPSTG